YSRKTRWSATKKKSSCTKRPCSSSLTIRAESDVGGKELSQSSSTSSAPSRCWRQKIRVPSVLTLKLKAGPPEEKARDVVIRWSSVPSLDAAHPSLYVAFLQTTTAPFGEMRA